MRTLHFRTNIDCPFRLQKAAYGLECLRGRYCQFSVDLLEANHLLTIKTEVLTTNEVIQALMLEGVLCVAIAEDP
jgi:hypothetical protein